MIDLREYITPEEPEIKQLSYQFGSVEEAFNWVKDNIISIPDEQDFWQRPIETLNRGMGDCEDQSNFLTSIFRAMKYDAYNFVFYIPERNENHAITILNNTIYDPTFIINDKKLPVGATIPNTNPNDYPIVAYDDIQIVVYSEDLYLNLL